MKFKEDCDKLLKELINSLINKNRKMEKIVECAKKFIYPRGLDWMGDDLFVTTVNPAMRVGDMRDMIKAIKEYDELKEVKADE